MTFQQPIQNYDNADADEASSLLASVTAASAPPFSLGQEGGTPATKKNGVLVRAMITTTACVFLGTIAVVYYGGSGSSKTSSGGMSAVLLRGHHQEAHLYDPNRDHCYTDTDNPGKECWSPTDKVPYGNWEEDGPHGNNNCGPTCTDNYDPNRDHCFVDKDNAGKECWYFTGSLPYRNWKDDGKHGNNNCGPKCTKVHDQHIHKYASSGDISSDLLLGQKKEEHLYDPNQDYCYTDKDNAGKECWYHTDHFPCGNWKEDGRHGNNNCGPKCTEVYYPIIGCHNTEDDEDDYDHHGDGY